ncbi:alcohol dehydrogenase catalytic domain-containing protein [Aeromicrobium sp. CF4.19]|uniref:alcohol dehydrogenase catalytic domain-containing protein n=1 Tax=Aeromicrobium sp. CF4.19 TaxID=3373082 RepID=UPI003EE5A4DD
MKAATWQGKRDVQVLEVPDPQVQDADDIVIRVTTTGLCGSDLHLYEVLGPFMHQGDVMGHETMGEVVEKGSAVDSLEIGDRVVIPFQIACGHCFMCERGLQTQCETTQVRSSGMGAALFGFSSLYGSVPGGQAEYLRVPHANYGAIRVTEDLPDERYVYLSDVLPTAWQGVRYADVHEGDTLAIVGLGPIGDMAARLALHQGIRVIGLDLVPERLARVQARGADVVNVQEGDPVEAVQALTSGRGADGVIDAVGMEAHGSPGPSVLQKAVGLLPGPVARMAMRTGSVDPLSALHLATSLVRRGGTVSISGVYAGTMDPMSLQYLFDHQVTLRMGQANVRRWVEDLVPLVERSDDPLGLESFATHRLPLADAAHAYDIFQRKADGAVKVVFKPAGG